LSTNRQLNASEELGTEEITSEDRSYQGSRFADVRDAIFANPYQKVWRGDSPMPRYEVRLAQFLKGILPFAGPYIFRKAVERAVDSHADLRWGKDDAGFLRLLHPNGVCLTGFWEITEPNRYSGYFRKGSKALAIGRYSTCCTETRRGYSRSLALVGKLYPTMDPEHLEPLRTANFITQQDLGGDFTKYLNDVETRNAPDVRAWRRGLGFPILAIEGRVFGSVDKEATIRQLYEVAELGKRDDEPTRTPKYLRLKIAAGHQKSDYPDFRDEIMAFFYDSGDPNPKRRLVFDIDVTDEASERGPEFFKVRTFSKWSHIGALTFTAAVASVNGDRVIHFHHPTWRADPDDPSTATRQNEKVVCPLGT
jgi:hypothetical protein